MMPLTETLLWCLLQVTLIASLALALGAGMRRWFHQPSAIVPAAALAIVVGLTICAFIPWPTWWRYGPDWEAMRSVADSDVEAVARQSSGIEPVLEADETIEPSVRSDSSQPATNDAEQNPMPASGRLGDRFSSVREGQSASQRNERSSVPWTQWLPTVVLFLLGIGAALGLLQLAGGLISVRSYRLASQPIDDSPLTTLGDRLRVELGLSRPVELRESQRLATAATIGWSRPVILLPPSWRQWTTEQRCAVLAHELAHVRHGDYLTCVLAQFSLALHFYHPLVHALAARLRLEQELAADAAAATLSGGQRTYLQTLAELALHASQRPLGWPAHTFLPTQGTFLRRIEMLRDSKTVASRPGRPSILKWAAVGLMLVGAAVVTGLRGGSSTSPFDQTAAAQGPATREATAEKALVDLSFVTNDAQMLLAVRPSAFLAREELRGALTQAVESGPPLVRLLSVKDLKQLTLVGPAGVEADDWNDQAIVILQFGQPVNVSELAAAGKWKLTELSATSAPPDAPGEMAYGKPDDKTVILGKAPQLARYMASRRKGKPQIAAGEGWEQVAAGALVAAIDMQAIRDEIAKKGPPRGKMPPELGAVAPLWQDTEYVAAGIILEGKDVHLRGVATCHDEALAENVAETAKAALTLARNAMRNSREREKNLPGFVTVMFDTAEKLLKSVKVEQTQSLVVAQTSTTIPDVKSAAGASLFGALTEARGAAQRMSSANNLKQIMIAMHNWADTYGGRFPPPVLYGKDGKGKVPHSWRVALLPYLEQQALYDQYHFDEPWDSPANKEVLAKMPAVFRHPSEDEKSTNASYYLLRPDRLTDERPEGGFPTAFSKTSGVRFADILDGTSNTIAVIEAKRDIPWTKPDDIVFDPAFAKPAIDSYSKEGFQAAFCDGAVKFISNKVEPKILQFMIMPQDGNPIPELSIEDQRPQ